MGLACGSSPSDASEARSRFVSIVEPALVVPELIQSDDNSQGHQPLLQLSLSRTRKVQPAASFMDGIMLLHHRTRGWPPREMDALHARRRGSVVRKQRPEKQGMGENYEKRQNDSGHRDEIGTCSYPARLICLVVSAVEPTCLILHCRHDFFTSGFGCFFFWTRSRSGPLHPLTCSGMFFPIRYMFTYIVWVPPLDSAIHFSV